jgi:hypothetical protein
LFFVREYTLHPQYRRITLSTRQVIWDYDVAILRVVDGTPLEGFPFVKPVVLPPPCAGECCGVCGGIEISMAGWVSLHVFSHPAILRTNDQQGRLANGSIPVYLQRLEQRVIPFSECRNHWEGQTTNRMFCVTSKFYDSCNGEVRLLKFEQLTQPNITGDSGSAILTSRVQQVGYVSFGSIVCGDGSAPAVYGRLEEPSIRAFVRQITGL